MPLYGRRGWVTSSKGILLPGRQYFLKIFFTLLLSSLLGIVRLSGGFARVTVAHYTLSVSMRPQESKISLRALDLGRIPDKKTVFETLMLHLNVPLIGLKPTKIGYLAITGHQNEIDRILDKKGKEKLASIGLEARLPIKLKAERSIVCRKIDSSVGEMTKDQLKTEINQKNRHIEVVEITKFGSYTHLFKIELQTIEQAQHVLQNGFLCFNTKIASHQIEKEELVTDILICFNCYKLEDHTSANCPTKETIVCSECTGNHNFKECRSEYKKCLNCGGPHRTMAMACPKEKEIIKQKRNQAKQKEQEKQDRPTLAWRKKQ